MNTREVKDIPNVTQTIVVHCNAVNPLPLGMMETGNWIVVRNKIVQHCKITAKYFVGQVLKAYEKHEFKVKFL